MPNPTFDSLTLAAVAGSTQELRGGQIQRIVQPDAHEVVFSIYTPGRGQMHWLFNASGRWFRTHLVAQRAKSTPGAEPTAFCMALRKYLDGGRVLSVEQRGFDRVLDVQIRGFEGETYRFIAELMGRNSNLFLVGPDDRVLHAARFVPADKPRPVLSGQSYLPLPPSARLDPRDMGKDEFLQKLAHDQPQDFAAWLAENFEGMSRFLVAEILARAADESLEARWAAFDCVFALAKTNAWQPVVVLVKERLAGAYPLPPLSTLDCQIQPRDDIHQALEQYFDFAVKNAALEDERRALQRILQKARNKREAALRQIERGVEESEKAARYRRWGEAILANLHMLHKGQTSAELPDYYAETPQTLTVALEPTLSPQENAARLFERARHVDENAENLKTLQRRMSDEKAELESALEQVEAARDFDDLQTLREVIKANGWMTANAQREREHSSTARPDFEGKKIRSFTSPDGYTVLVGENAEANDYLVQRASAPDDWWLHVRAHASAHVIIRAHKEPQKVPQSTLHFAARLAAQRSAAKHSHGVDVDYTLRKHVRRPRRAAPGQVLRTHEKTLFVTME